MTIDSEAPTTAGGLARPAVTAEDAARVAREHWGVEGEPRELGSQQDRNFKVAGPEEAVVLKFANTASTPAELEAQNLALRLLAESGLLVPTARPSVRGDAIERIEVNGVELLARALDYVHGTPLIDIGAFGDEEAIRLGDTSGRVAAALSGFVHDGTLRDSQWSLRVAADVVTALLHHVPEEWRRDALAVARDAARARLEPLVAHLPEQVIHADVTDDNVVVTPGGRLGVIDLGDLQWGWRVAELAATGAAVFAHDGPDPVALLVEAVRAFCRHVRLTDAELAAVWPLIVLRTAVLVVSGEEQVRLDDDNEYADVRRATEWRSFRAAAALDADELEALIRSAAAEAGQDGSGRSTSPEERMSELGRVLPEGVSPNVLDLSVTSPWLDGGAWLEPGVEERALFLATAGADPHGFTGGVSLARGPLEGAGGDGSAGGALDEGAPVEGALEPAAAEGAATRWGEYRLTRTRTRVPRGTSATFALGVQLRLPQGTLLVAPFDGEVVGEDGGSVAVVATGLTGDPVVVDTPEEGPVGEGLAAPVDSATPDEPIEDPADADPADPAEDRAAADPATEDSTVTDSTDAPAEEDIAAPDEPATPNDSAASDEPAAPEESDAESEDDRAPALTLHVDAAVVHVRGPVRRGDVFGSVGEEPVRLQLSTVRGIRPPFLVTPHAEAQWRRVSPDPSPLIGVDVAAPAPDPEGLLERREAAFARVQEHYYRTPPQIERGWREHLVDSTAQSYVDVVNNVTTVGHAHPRLVETAARQWALLNTNSRFHYAAATELSERLAALAPEGLDTVFLVNSGSEAVDLALRLAMTATGRRRILAAREAYHGWTIGSDAVTTSLGDNPRALGSRPGWVELIDAPNPVRGTHRGPDAGPAYLADLDARLESLGRKGRAKLAGVILEPVFGNGGGVLLPEGYLAGVYERVRALGGVCIADEVQVGYGRLGDWFWGFEQQGAVPDVITVAKAMGNGQPLGAVITTRAIAEAFSAEGSFFSSAGGSPVSARLGVTVLDIMADEGLQANAAQVGARLRDGLRGLADGHPSIGAVHGHGLYLGVELVTDRESFAPATELADRVCEAMLDEGVVVQPTGDHKNVLKVKPPLCIDADSADAAVAALDRVLTTLSA